MLHKKDLLIISHLRQNARKNLTAVSRETGIPVSTLFDKLKVYENAIIKKHSALLNFNSLGFSTKANIIIKVNKEQRESMKQCLIKNQNVNSVFKINNDFDFMIEGIFRNIKDLEEFLEILDEKFDIKKREVFYIIDELKREDFMSNPAGIDLIGF